MAWDLDAVVGPDGWTTSAALTSRVHRRTVTAWVAAGKLVRLEPGIYATPQAAGSWRVRVAAALGHREAVASHGTALALWELADPPTGPVELTVDPGTSSRGPAGAVLHRAPDAYGQRRRVDGLAVSSVERAVVDTWGRPGSLGRVAVRAAAISAVRQRLCSATDLEYELAAQPNLPGRAELAALTRLLADGCQSELEIWGCLQVLRGPGMPMFVQQRKVVVGGETFVLDAACEDVLLAIEMDGAAWHGSRRQREADIRRDALVATVGWQTLRFGFRRMFDRPAECRRDIIAVHAARLQLLAGGSAH